MRNLFDGAREEGGRGLSLPVGFHEEDGVVYEDRFGGNSFAVGYVKDGVAYEMMIWGKDRAIIDARFG